MFDFGSCPPTPLLTEPIIPPPPLNLPLSGTYNLNRPSLHPQVEIVKMDASKPNQVNFTTTIQHSKLLERNPVKIYLFSIFYKKKSKFTSIWGIWWTVQETGRFILYLGELEYNNIMKYQHVTKFTPPWKNFHQMTDAWYNITNIRYWNIKWNLQLEMIIIITFYLTADINPFTLHVINHKVYCLVYLWHFIPLYIYLYIQVHTNKWLVHGLWVRQNNASLQITVSHLTTVR